MSKARECEGKTRHPSKAEAEAHIWALVRQGTRRRTMKSYQCPHCGAWHVAHTRPRTRR